MDFHTNQLKTTIYGQELQIQAMKAVILNIN